MARLILPDSGGTARVLKRFGLVDSGGTPRMLKRLFLCDSGGVPRLVYQSLRVATQPSNVAGSQAAGNPSGTVTSSVASCLFVGSNEVLSYAWHATGCTADSPNSDTTTFSAAVNADSTDNASAYCTGSDGVTSVNTNTIAVALTNTTPAIQIISGTITDDGVYPAAASAAVWFSSNGNQMEQSNQYPNGQSMGLWNPGGASGAYDFRATLQSGVAPDWSQMNNGLNTWIEATSDTLGASWGITVTKSTGATATCTLLIEAAEHGTGVAIASGTVTLYADDAS